MGASTSACLNAEDLEELRADQNACGFSNAQLEHLYRRFQELDRKQSGVLSTAELQLIPELAMNPLCHRIIALFDQDRNDCINFKHFAETLWIFSDKCLPERKMKAAFCVYDVNDDGKITNSDLQHILKLMVGNNLPDEKLSEIAASTIEDSDPDKKGYLTLRDFQQTVDIKEVSKALNIKFLFGGAIY